MSVPLPAGVYNVSVTGTYNYDDLPGFGGTAFDSQRADAECSTASPFGDGILDTVLQPSATGLEPSPVSEWQRYRYLIIATGTPGVFPLDPLDLQINGLPTEWLPPSPTVIEHTPDGVVVLCDTDTHTYETVAISFGPTSPTTFQIYDLFYPDNSGGPLMVTIHPIA